MKYELNSIIEIDLDKVILNYRTICQFVDPALVIPVLKGNAYGHGIIPIARTLIEGGCRIFAVAKIDEAAQLRRAGITADKANIIIMSALLPSELKVAVELDASVFISDFQQLDHLKMIASGRTRPVDFHIKVDTGMGRTGFMPNEAGKVAQALKDTGNCRLKGFASHLTAPKLKEQNNRQMERFLEFIDTIRPKGDYLMHIASSSAVAKYPEMALNAVRVGDLIYGLCSVEKPPFCLYPVLKYKTKVVQIKNLPKGWHVGYGAERWINKPTRTATLPVGSVDGLMSSQVNKTSFLVNEKKCKLMAVCADSSIIDIDTAGEVKVGDEVVIIGTQGKEELSAYKHALAGGVGFCEFLAKISLRIPRIYIKNGEYAGELSADGAKGVAAL